MRYVPFFFLQTMMMKKKKNGFTLTMKKLKLKNFIYEENSVCRSQKGVNRKIKQI